MSKKNIVALISMAGFGKDSIGKIFIDKGYKRIAFADKVKEDFINLPRNKFRFNFSGGLTMYELEKDKDFYRNDLIKFAEEKRKSNELYWLNRVKADIEFGKENIVITDLRRIPEIDYLQDLKKQGHNVKIINIYRPYSNGGKFDNDGETCKAILYGEYGGFFDCRIVNASTQEELNKVVDQLIIDFKL